MPQDPDAHQDLSAVTWPVRTARLTIRPSTADDADAMYDIRCRPEVAEWLPILPTDRAAWAERFAEPDRLAMTLAFELDGEIIGDLFLRITDAWAQAEVEEQGKATQAEIGWVLAPEHAGQGFATEGARELLRICFEDLGLRRVVALAFADNTASRRIMDKIGMRLEEHAVRDSLHRTRGWLDGVGYAILVDEWRAQQA